MLVLPQRCVCVCVCVCPSIYFCFKNAFLCNHLTDQCETLKVAGTPRGEYFIANSDVIGHVVWQPYGLKGKMWTSFSPKLLNEKKLKLGICHQLPIGVYRVITMTSSVKYSSHNWLNWNSYLKHPKLHIYVMYDPMWVKNLINDVHNPCQETMWHNRVHGWYWYMGHDRSSVTLLVNTCSMLISINCFPNGLIVLFHWLEHSVWLVTGSSAPPCCCG